MVSTGQACFEIAQHGIDPPERGHRFSDHAHQAMEYSPDGYPYNTGLITDAEGTIRLKYRKL